MGGTQSPRNSQGQPGLLRPKTKRARRDHSPASLALGRQAQENQVKSSLGYVGSQAPWLQRGPLRWLSECWCEQCEPRDLGLSPGIYFKVGEDLLSSLYILKSQHTYPNPHPQQGKKKHIFNFIFIFKSIYI